MDREGKNRVFDFFSMERDRFKSYLRRKIQCIDDMDAEDIIGDVMLNIFNRVDFSGPVENLTAYIYRSLHNKIIDFQRKNKRTVSLNSFMDNDRETTLMDLLEDTGMQIADEAERNERKASLLQAIGKLEPRQRAVFVATEIEGYSFKELSARWNEPVGTLLSRKCRASKALQEMLKDLRDS